MEEQHKPESIQSLVADIRNKLGPVKNLIAMLNSGVQMVHPMTIDNEVERVLPAIKIVTEQLEKIMQMAESLYTIEDMWLSYGQGTCNNEDSWADINNVFQKWIEENYPQKQQIK